jgi:hypothetical protein
MYFTNKGSEPVSVLMNGRLGIVVVVQGFPFFLPADERSQR